VFEPSTSKAALDCIKANAEVVTAAEEGESRGEKRKESHSGNGNGKRRNF